MIENSMSVSSLGHGQEFCYNIRPDPCLALGCSDQILLEIGNGDDCQAVRIDVRSGKEWDMQLNAGSAFL